MADHTRLWVGIEILVFIVIGLFILSSFFFPVQKAEAKVIKIGAIFPLSGRDADWGLRCQRGVELAMEDVNNSGVIIDVIYEDSKSDSKQAVTSAQKMINVDQVQAIFCQLSDICSALAPVAQENGVVLFGFSHTPGLTEAGDFVFNLRGDATHAGRGMGEFASGKYGKVAVFYLNNPTQKGFYEGFKETYEADGGKMVFSEFHQSTDSDFRTALAKAKEFEPDALAFFTRVPTTIELVKQSRESGLNQPIIGSLGIDTQALLDGLGDLADGIVYTTSLISDDISEPGLLAALERYDNRFNESMPMWVAETYDGIRLLALVGKEGASTPEQIRDALMEVKDFPGLSADITFDEKRLVAKDYIIYTVKDGRFVPYGD